MRVAYITAGAAGTFCGSCLHDNTLAAALIAEGVDTLLIPTYTPIRTDEEDVSQSRVFFGGINVYLQQKLALFRHTPWSLDRLFDARRLLKMASRFAVKTRAEDLGDLTISMLRGEHGHQKKEIDKLIHSLVNDIRPDLIQLTGALLSGMVEEIRDRVNVPVLCSLQGDDIFLEALSEPFRKQAIELIQRHCRLIDSFIATSASYADFMSEYLDIPRGRIHVVYPGIDISRHGNSQSRSPHDGVSTVGYFARICPEKGLHILVEAFRILRQSADAPRYKLRISGWLGENNRPFLDEQLALLTRAGLRDDVEYVDSPTHADKVRFLRSLTVFSVPTVYREPKGLSILEAMANGVPVVQPRHGSFPELIGKTGGGWLVNPNDPTELANTLKHVLSNPGLRDEIGQKGMEAVRADFNASNMARNTMAIYQQHLSEHTHGKRISHHSAR